MPSLNITKSFSDGDILLELDIDNIRQAPETLLNITKIDDDNVQNSGISSIKLINATVVNSLITDDTIDTTRLAADSVDKTKIAADLAGDGLTQAAGGELDVSVDDSTVEINIDTLRLKDAGVTSAKFQDNSITSIKRVAPVVNRSSSSGSFSTTSATYVTPTNLTKTFTKNQSTRAVLVYLEPDGTTNPARLQLQRTLNTDNPSSTFKIERSTNGGASYDPIMESTLEDKQTTSGPFDNKASLAPFVIYDDDTAGFTGSMIYRMQVKSNAGFQIDVHNYILAVMEY